MSRLALGPTQPPIQWVQRAISPGLKRLVCEADHSPPSSAEVRNGGAIPPKAHMFSWHSAYLINPKPYLLKLKSFECLLIPFL
jgi:hypothetical protein